MTRSAPPVDRLSWALAGLFAADRLLKLGAVVNFFSRPRPSPPYPWPSVTLLQPITRGAGSLSAALEARARLDYPAPIQHLLVCDAGDGVSQEVCRAWMARHSDLDASIILVDWPEGSRIAPKTVKLRDGLAHAEGDVVCCVDDDIMLRPGALRTMLPYLCEARAGAVFGLACYTNWGNLPSSLMSAFVNANALLTYIPGAYLTEPFTITGHIFALRRATLEQIEGFGGMDRNVGDDHETARRVRSAGLRAVLTPIVYDVDNHLPTLRAYAAQMKRWFVFPRQAMLPMMRPREQAVTLLGSAGNLIPSLLALLALATPRSAAPRALASALGLFCAVYAICERLYLRRSTPLGRWPLVPVVGLLAPAQIVAALFSSNEVEWRGRRILISSGGDFREVGAG